MDDFFVRALVAGVGVALIAGPLGCIIVWRRLAYFGDTLSHAALLGVALALLLNVSILLAVFAVSLAIAICLIGLKKQSDIASDSLLGLMSHGALAIGLVVLAFLTGVRVDLMAFLFGDILAVTVPDIAVIYGGGILVLGCLAMIWRTLFASTVSHDLAAAEGLNPDRAELLFMVLMATVIALAMKIVGVLLITALLIIPAAAARRFSSGPEQMAVLASLIGTVAVIGGLFSSLEWDTPSGPSIVVAGVLCFLISLMAPRRRLRQTNRPEQRHAAE